MTSTTSFRSPSIVFSGGAASCFDLHHALPHDHAHEPGHFSGHHRRNLTVLPQRQPLERLPEPVLHLPAVVHSVRRMALLPMLQHLPAPRRKTVAPRRLHQHVTDPAVARLRDAARRLADASRDAPPIRRRDTGCGPRVLCSAARGSAPPERRVATLPAECRQGEWLLHRPSRPSRTRRQDPERRTARCTPDRWQAPPP